MLSILLAWIVIFIVFYSFGQISLLLCDKLFKSTSINYYNCFDILLVGMCALMIPLQLWSLFLPSNHIFLGICLIVALVFLVFNRSIWAKEFQRFKRVVASLSGLQLAILIFFILLAFWSSIWLEGNFDSEFYHYQAIRWNEEYPIIPGLANFEDRLAFNSSFFLLNAIFSFRFLWGEAVYSLQLFFFIALVLWALVSMFKSNGGVKQVIVFNGVILFSVLYVMQLVNTSTDILPNLIFFYLAINIFLSVDDLLNKKILFFVLPFLLITLKISLAPIGLISIYIYIMLCRQSKMKSANVLLIASSLIVVLWLIRNVIISGYLIYPIYELDFFAVDWKLPREIAMLQKQYIHDYPISVWKETLEAPFTRVSRPVWANLLVMGVVILLLFSSLLSTIYFIKRAMKKQLDTSLLLILIASLLIVVMSILNGFDLRFINGALVGLIVLGGLVLCSYLKITQLKRLQYLFVVAFFLTYGVWTGTFSRDRFSAVKEYGKQINCRPLESILQTPYPAHEYMIMMKYIDSSSISKEKIDSKFDLHISNIFFGQGHFPLAYRIGEAHHGILVDYRCLKARGDKIEDGFRLDTVCMNESLKGVKKAMREKGY